MTAESKVSSSPQRKRGRKPRVISEDLRTCAIHSRITPELADVLRISSERLGLDQSTLVFNIIRFATSRKSLTDEEYLAYARPSANTPGFKIWQRGD